MARPKQPLCPACKIRQKPPGCSYCRECRRARQRKPKHLLQKRGRKPDPNSRRSIQKDERKSWLACSKCGKPNSVDPKHHKDGKPPRCKACKHEMFALSAKRKGWAKVSSCVLCNKRWSTQSFKDELGRRTRMCRTCRHLGIDDNTDTLKCSSCGKIKPVSPESFVNPRYWPKHGQPYCRCCYAQRKAERQHEYYEAHKKRAHEVERW